VQNRTTIAVLHVGVVRPRRSLLRGVVSKVSALAPRLPFPAALFPADTLELRAADTSVLHVNNAVLDVVVVRLFPGAVTRPNLSSTNLGCF